ncbi:MAG: hypothetical protein JHC87_02995 [Thermoleophilaceae bacterium]|nr:hypothetical protein [Thermoleophilaceae bacterium]
MTRNAFRISMAVAFVVMTAAIAAVLHSNPFGTGSMSWVAAWLIAIGGNIFLALALAPRIAPYLAAPPVAPGQPGASPERIRVATLITAVVMMTASLICLGGVSAVSGDPIIVPTKRLENNAKLVRATMLRYAPAEFRGTINAADTWNLKKNFYRSCVPAKDDKTRAWCVLIYADDNGAHVRSYGRGKPNAVLFMDSKQTGKPPLQ